MYRQKSAPSLTKMRASSSSPVPDRHHMPAGAAATATATTIGNNNGDSKRAGMRRAGSMGSFVVGANSNNSNHSHGSSTRNSVEDEAQRRKILEILQLLGNHLAGCVVDFLIEEVERKVLNDYAHAAMRDGSNVTNDGDDQDHVTDEDDSENVDNHESSEELEVDVIDFDATEANDETEVTFAGEEDEERDELSPLSSKPKIAGLGSLYGGVRNIGSNSFQQQQQQQTNNLGRMYGPSNTMSRKPMDASPVMPSRGVRNLQKTANPLSSHPQASPFQTGSLRHFKQDPLSPRRSSAQTDSLRHTNHGPVSPRRNTPQVGNLKRHNDINNNNNNNRTTFAAKRPQPGMPFLSFDDDDETEADQDGEGGRNSNILGSTKNGSASQFRFKEPESAVGLKRIATLPDRLDPEPQPLRLLSHSKSLSPESSPKRFSSEMTISRKSSPKHHPGKFLDIKPPPFQGDQDINTGAKSPTQASPKPISNRRNLLAGSRFESDAPKSDPTHPRPTMKKRGESVRNINLSIYETREKRPERPGLGSTGHLMVKQGSVRNVMSMFEPKKEITTRPTMPLLREDSVKNIMKSLSTTDDDDNKNKTGQNGSLTNLNEAPDSASNGTLPTSPLRPTTPPPATQWTARPRTPPKMPNKLSSKSPLLIPDSSPKRGVQRNSSGIRMQRFLEKRSIDRSSSGVKAFLGKKGSGSSQGSAGPPGIAKPSLVRRSSSGSVKRGVERASSGIRRGVRRVASGLGGRRKPPRQFSFGTSSGTCKSSSFGIFAKDKVTNKLSHDTRKQKRIFKTQNALRKLRKAAETDQTPYHTEGSESGLEDYELDNLVNAITLTLPCAVKHDCALLFVDISGFTQLSTTLKVEKLSKTINDYFQLIVEHVQAFGGDILKFAGDAVFVEWRASASTLLETNPDDVLDATFGGDGLGAEKAVITAAACAARIIDKCADYHVYDDYGKKVATLNLHCAVGFGEVVGVHVGNSDRMEYFIIGEPIKQVAAAMDQGKMGEVVASPACLKYLDGDMTGKSKVILSKSNKLMNPKLMLVKAEKGKKNQDSKLADRLDDWDIPALRSLQKLMSPYVHPVVVENQLFQKGYGSAQERFTSEAEIRDVFTVFIQPMVSSDVMGKISDDSDVLKTLHNILVIVNNELRKFKGQLRQYAVDDKGIVLIANFGLRGSTFPQMVERLAMPFATNVQQILKAKLDVDCKMGATFGKAYCGVVGGVERHEYAVLGPSVNLAARLMANKSNKGFLVDEEVKRKASNRGFEGLAPVKAKGYRELVAIYEPTLHHRRSWGSQGADFVGRMSEIKQILKLTEDVIDASASTSMVWVSAESGYGKSALLGHATEKIQELCSSKSATHVLLCHVCSDADSFQPLSAVGPLCLDILAFVRRNRNESIYKKPEWFAEIAKLAKPGSEKAPIQIFCACRDAEIPDAHIRTICRLLLTQSWPVEADEDSRETQINDVARCLVTVLLQSTIHLDLIAWAVDDIPHADQLSWKVLELLHQYSCNFMLLMGSRPVAGTDMHVDLQFWDLLNDEGVRGSTFLFLELKAMAREEVDLMVKKYAASKEWHASVDLASISKDVFVQSGGVPYLAAQILERKSPRIPGTLEESRMRSKSPKGRGKSHLDRLRIGYMGRQSSNNSLESGSAHSGSVAQVGEHMLHRMDLLSPEARTHINLGAILGPAFESADVISVMERYRGISEKDKLAHRELVQESLAQAAESGILEEDLTGAGMSMSFCAQENFMGQESITYKFTHDDWRKNILKVVLDSWKRDMYLLLAESLEARFEFNSARPERAIRKLFEPFKGGRKKGKNISVASELALKIGEKMVRSGHGKHSLSIFKKALELWQTSDEGDDILVMSEEDNDSKSDELLGEDLEYVLKLNAAVGRCAMFLMDKDKSIAAFEANLDLVPDSKKLKDPGLIFPSFCGRFYALRLARKVDHESEADFVYSFVEDAEAHKEQIHHLQALAMEAEIFGRNGECDKALEACTDLRKLYNVSFHSARLVEIYGDDYCAQCIAQSANWHLQLSQEAKAREVCTYIVEILPNVAGHDNFLVIFPVLWAMKNLGEAERGLKLCRQYFSLNETKGLEIDEDHHDYEDGGHFNNSESDLKSEKIVSISPFQVVYKPITMLLDLAAGMNDHANIVEYVDWAVDASKSEYDKSFNTFTANVGRNADSIIAELCLMLATHRDASTYKDALLSRASAMVASSMKLTKHIPMANKQVKGFAFDKQFKGL